MKAFIWFACLFLTAGFMVAIQNLAEFTLNPLLKTLMVAGACALAAALCKKINKVKNDTEDNEDDQRD